MSSLAFTGSGCFGFIWGWYIGQVSGIHNRQNLAYLFTGTTTLILSTQVYFLVDWPSTIAFLIAAFSTLMLHSAWLKMITDTKNQVKGVVNE